MDKIVKSVTNALKANVDPKYKVLLARYGIPDGTAMGVRTPAVRKIAKEAKVEVSKAGLDRNTLATHFFNQGLAEYRVIAGAIADPETFPSDQARVWASQCNSWGETDTISMGLLPHLADAREFALTWPLDTTANHAVRRAGLVIMAMHALKKFPQHPDAFYTPYIDVAIRASDDDEHLVRRGASWALRGIGKRNEKLSDKVLSLMKKMIDDEQTGKGALWVARDVFRELEAKRKPQAKTSSRRKK